MIAELFLDGHPPFTFAQLLSYRKGDNDIRAFLNKIDDLQIRVWGWCERTCSFILTGYGHSDVIRITDPPVRYSASFGSLLNLLMFPVTFLPYPLRVRVAVSSSKCLVFAPTGAHRTHEPARPQGPTNGQQVPQAMVRISCAFCVLFS